MLLLHIAHWPDQWARPDLVKEGMRSVVSVLPGEAQPCLLHPCFRKVTTIQNKIVFTNTTEICRLSHKLLTEIFLSDAFPTFR